MNLGERIEGAIRDRFGVPVRVEFNFRVFALTCRRIDGFPLTPGMRAMFNDLIEREAREEVAYA